MNKTQLIGEVSKRMDITKKSARDAVETVFGTVSDALSKGDKVQLIGFGSFEVRRRKARQGRNPQTGRPLRIPAKKYPAFRAGKVLRDSVQKRR